MREPNWSGRHMTGIKNHHEGGPAMGINRNPLIGALVLILALSQTDLTYGAKESDAQNFRGGANVSVAPDEVISEGLLAAGANVQISGNVSGGLKAFGANVVVPGKVQGESSFFGANIVLSGTFQNKVKGAAANIILSGTFEDNVEVAAARIILTPATVIKGDLIYAAATLDRQEGSQITGKLIQKELAKKNLERWGPGVAKALLWLWILCWILSIPALIILGMLINYLSPRQTEAIVSTISESPWKSLGIGFVFLVLVPVAIMISFFTLVGIPAGIIAGVLYGTLIYVSRVYIGLWIGRKFLGYIKKPLATAFFWPLVVGIVIIALVGLIPFIGWLFRLFILLISLGAMWTAVWRLLQQERTKSAL
jgi:hypothetical protein